MQSTAEVEEMLRITQINSSCGPEQDYDKKHP